MYIHIYIYIYIYILKFTPNKYKAHNFPNK